MIIFRVKEVAKIVILSLKSLDRKSISSGKVCHLAPHFEIRFAGPGSKPRSWIQ